MSSVLIQELEDILDGKTPRENVNDTLFRAYRNSREKHKYLLDFDDVLCAKDVKPIADALRKYGIRKFTISCRMGELIDRLEEFQQLNVCVKGTIRIKYLVNTFGYDEQRERPAVLLEVLPVETEDYNVDWSNEPLDIRMRHYEQLNVWDKANVVSDALNSLREEIKALGYFLDLRTFALRLKEQVELCKQDATQDGK